MGSLSSTEEFEDEDSYHPAIKVDLKIQIKNFPVTKAVIHDRFQELLKKANGDRYVVERGFRIIDDQLYLFDLANSKTKDNEKSKAYTEKLRQYKKDLIQIHFEPRGAETENTKQESTDITNTQSVINKYKSRILALVYDFYF